MRRTRILVADSLQIFRSGVRNLLARESDFEIVEAGSLDEVLDAVAQDCPDIALIDLELPPYGGVAAVQQLAQRCSTYTIVWSFEPSRETVLDAVRVRRARLPPQGHLAGRTRARTARRRPGRGAAVARPRLADDRRTARPRRACARA